jgi:ribosomal protein S18 acetylase RimI-like enzyme
MPEYFGSTYEEEVLNPKLKFETYIEQDLPGHFMLGAFEDNELIGLAGFDRAHRKKTLHRGALVQVYVDVKYRGQKIGERLIRKVLEDAFALDGIEQIELSAVANNQGAIRLYEKLGFKTYGIQPGYFKVEDGYTDQAFMYLIKENYQK